MYALSLGSMRGCLAGESAANRNQTKHQTKPIIPGEGGRENMRESVRRGEGKRGKNRWRE